ncbi:MAG: kynureninase [Mycobacteriales bacterium]
MSDHTERRYAQGLDDADVLAGFRDRVVIADPEQIYLDGNSLGRLPATTATRLQAAVTGDWGRGLVGSWQGWVEQATRVGDLIGTELLGAAAGEVAVSDSTSVNLYKLAAAALGAHPDRRVIVTDDDNFPTDRYVLAGLAEQRGCELRVVHSDIDGGLDSDDLSAAIDDDVALVTLSHVAYRSGARIDLAACGELAHAHGALVLWDLSHSAGSVSVELSATGADLAVGCTYKYLCAGPGAPAFLYVRSDLQAALRQPIWGWFGQSAQFEMGAGYDPHPSIRRFGVGTPSVLATYAVEEGARLIAEAGVDRLAAKGAALTTLAIELADEWLAPLGLRVVTPRDPGRRGAHITLQHPAAWQICQALVHDGVVADYRTPQRLRLGPAPLYTRFVDVYDAIVRLRELVASGRHARYDAEPTRVT